MKIKHQSELITENERVAIPSMTLQFGKLCTEKQTHPSH